MAQRLIAYNDCEILCMAHPYAISQIMPHNTCSFYSNNDINYDYKSTIYGIELKACNVMRHNQIFLFPYIFKDGFPCVVGASGVIEMC